MDRDRVHMTVSSRPAANQPSHAIVSIFVVYLCGSSSLSLFTVSLKNIRQNSSNQEIDHNFLFIHSFFVYHCRNLYISIILLLYMSEYTFHSKYSRLDEISITFV